MADQKFLTKEQQDILDKIISNYAAIRSIPPENAVEALAVEAGILPADDAARKVVKDLYLGKIDLLSAHKKVLALFDEVPLARSGKQKDRNLMFYQHLSQWVWDVHCLMLVEGGPPAEQPPDDVVNNATANITAILEQMGRSVSHIESARDEFRVLYREVSNYGVAGIKYWREDLVSQIIGLYSKLADTAGFDNYSARLLSEVCDVYGPAFFPDTPIGKEMFRKVLANIYPPDVPYYKSKLF